MVVKQYDIHLVCLDPTIGQEIKKTRPCLIISPNEMNKHISTVMIAPLTTKSRAYPTRVPVKVKGKNGWVVLDQIRTIDKKRLIKKIGKLTNGKIQQAKLVIKEMLID